MALTKPVYMINGFLESGKTEFITFTIGQPYFQIKGTTLLLLCEEGEKEYPADLLKQSKTVVEVIENEEDFTVENLTKLEKQHKADRIVIEYNGMWNCKDLKLPRHWRLEQQITMIDGSTFPTYYANMKSMVAEMIRNSEMIIINRCDEVRDQLNVYRRNIKAVNRNADVIFEDANGEIDEIFEEDLPFDLNADVIEMDDEGYSIFFLDSMDHLDRYLNKKIKFLAMVHKPKDFPKGYFVPGRKVMTCCAQDMSFLGYTCEYSDVDSLKQGSFITVTATVDRAFRPEYKGMGPVLRAEKIEPAKAPKNEVISLGG